MAKSTATTRHDRIDRRILHRLQRDGRIANLDLADAVALSPSACLRRTKSLEADGVIAGYRAELDQRKLGLGLTVFVALKVTQHSQETSRDIEAALVSCPYVVGCYLVSGEADFLVQLMVPDLAAYERVLLGELLAIPQVTGARSTFAIRTILDRGPLPLDHWT